MAHEGLKRKLTAILSADVEGYSRLMGEDEDATIRTLTTYRELMSTLIQNARVEWWTLRVITYWQNLAVWLMLCDVRWRSRRNSG